MREWLSTVANDRLPELAVALGLGIGLATLADHVARVPVAVLAQHAGRDPSGQDPEILGLLDLFSAPYFLNVSIGGTIVAYGQVLSALLAFGLVGIIAWLVVRRRDRALGECPFCASRIPYESTHCAYCGSAVAPGEPSLD